MYQMSDQGFEPMTSLAGGRRLDTETDFRNIEEKR